MKKADPNDGNTQSALLGEYCIDIDIHIYIFICVHI
jgi:hypothetical protein